MTLFFRSRFLRIVLGILTVLFSRISHARQAVECSYPGHPESHFIVSTQSASEYMDHEYSCHLIEVQDSYSVSSEDVNQSQEKKSTHVVGKNSKLDLSYQECVDKIRTSTGPMSQEVIRCYRRVAPEVAKGRPLTPEHAKLLSLRLSSEDAVSFEEPALSRALITSPAKTSDALSSQLTEVQSCLQEREIVLRVVRSSSKEKLQMLKELKYVYHDRFAAADQPERHRLSDELNGQIASLVGMAARADLCFLGDRRSMLGQNPSPAERTRARLSVKGSGTFDYSDDILTEAVHVTEYRGLARGGK